MTKTKRYPVEVRERAVRLVLEHRGEYETKGEAIAFIAQKFGCAAVRYRVEWPLWTICLALWLLLAAGVTGCGTTDGRAIGVSKAAVEGRLKMMLSDLEDGRYQAACESFSLRSEVGMTIASALDGHESSSSCSDVFVVGGALRHLGLSRLAQTLQHEADQARLTKIIDLPTQAVHMLYSGIIHTRLTPVIENLKIEDGTARYQDRTIALTEDGRWVLEVVQARVTTTELASEVSRECSQPSTLRFLGARLCSLMHAVFAGKVLNGAEHREFIQLFPRAAELPSRELRAFQRAYGDGNVHLRDR